MSDSYIKLFIMNSKINRSARLQPRRALAFGQRMVPELKISGLWLEAMGFHAGQMVEITVHQGELIIKPQAR